MSKDQLKDYLIQEINNTDRANRRYNQNRIVNVRPNYAMQAQRLNQFDINQIRNNVRLTREPYQPTDNDIIYDNEATISGIYDQYILLDSAFRKPDRNGDNIKRGILKFDINDINRNPNADTGSIGVEMPLERLFELSFGPFYLPGQLPNIDDSDPPVLLNESPFFFNQIIITLEEFESQVIRAVDRNFHYTFFGVQDPIGRARNMILMTPQFPVSDRYISYKPHYELDEITLRIQGLTGSSINLKQDVFFNPQIVLPGTNPMQITLPNHGIPDPLVNPNGAANNYVILRCFKSTNNTLDSEVSSCPKNEKLLLATYVDDNTISIDVDATSLTNQPTIDRLIIQNRRIIIPMRVRGLAGFATQYIVHT